MYERFFGLTERPFDLTPNPRYLYLTDKHREALSTLQYGITGKKGITVLTGEAGTGKTTLVRAAVQAVAGPSMRCVCVNNPTLQQAEFYEFLAPKFGLSERATGSKARFLFELEQSLLARRRAGCTTAIIVDEAQSLPPVLMEEIRLLANFETDTEKLLPLVLAGQPELTARLEQTDFRQLKQRVALRCELAPLEPQETAAYVNERIAVAGGQAASIFTGEAVRLIHERSRGIPRTISVICDNAMVTAFALGEKPIGPKVVLEVCRDFKLPAATRPGHRAGVDGARERVGAFPAGGPSDGRERPSRPPLRIVPSEQRAAEGGASGGGEPPRAEQPRGDAPWPPTRHGAPLLFSHFTRRRRFSFF